MRQITEHRNDWRWHVLRGAYSAFFSPGWAHCPGCSRAVQEILSCPGSVTCVYVPQWHGVGESHFTRVSMRSTNLLGNGTLSNTHAMCYVTREIIFE